MCRLGRVGSGDLLGNDQHFNYAGGVDYEQQFLCLTPRPSTPFKVSASGLNTQQYSNIVSSVNTLIRRRQTERQRARPIPRSSRASMTGMICPSV